MSLTHSAVSHGDGSARALLHQIHDLPEELAGNGGARAVQLKRLSRNTRDNDEGEADARREERAPGKGNSRRRATRHRVALLFFTLMYDCASYQRGVRVGRPLPSQFYLCSMQSQPCSGVARG